MKSVYFTKTSILPLIAAVAFVSLAACSRSAQKPEDDPGPSPAIELSDTSEEAGQLFNRARESLAKGQYETAVLQYENLEANYPFGDHAAQARLDVAYAYYRQRELDNAIATLDSYLKLYPQSEKTDYAYYLKGLVNYSRGKGLFESLVPRKMDQLDQVWLRASLADLSTLIQKFPNSSYVEDAENRSSELLDHMAQHELQTANYYYNRSAMVAAINRINYMLEQYPETKHSAEGLALLARAHRALGNDKTAEDVTTTLRTKHPDFTKI